MDIVNQGLSRRYRAEKRFRIYGISAVIVSMIFLLFLFISIAANGYTAFQQTYVQLDIRLDPEMLDTGSLADANYQGMVKQSLSTMFPQVKSRKEKQQLYGMVSNGAAFQLQDFVRKNQNRIGSEIQLWVPADDDVDMVVKGHVDRGVPESDRRVKDNQLAWIDRLQEQGRLEKRFNTTFFQPVIPGSRNWQVSGGPWQDLSTPCWSPWSCPFLLGWLPLCTWKSSHPKIGGPILLR